MTTGRCITCKKPVCVTCMKLRGYFCSDACKDAYLSSRPAVQQESENLSDAQMNQWSQHGEMIASWLFKRVPLLVLALVLCVAALSYLDKSGTETWSVQPPKDVSFVEAEPSGDTVYVRCSDGQCLSLSSASGAEKWGNRAAPAASDGADWSDGYFQQAEAGLKAGEGLVLRSHSKSFSAILAATGKTLWERSMSSFEREPAVLTGGRVLLVDEFRAAVRSCDEMNAEASAESDGRSGGERATESSLVCADANSGSELWRRTFKGRRIGAAEASGDTCFCMTCIPPHVEWNPCPSHAFTNEKARAVCSFCQRELSKASSFEMHVIRMTDGMPLWTGQMTSGVLDQIRLYENRIVAVAGTHLYILSLDGEKTAHPRLPADTRRVCVSGDYVAAATRSGRLLVLSSRDGKMIWEQQIGGKASNLEIAADSLYVTARLPRALSDRLPDGTPTTPVPRSAAQQLLEEVTGQHRNGDPDDEGIGDLFSDLECRTLINFSLANGNERWRHQPLSGDLHLLPDGNCLLLDQGFGLAALFRGGGDTYLTEHLQKSGKAIWKCQIPDSVFSVKADAHSVYLLTRNREVTSGKSPDAPGNNSTLRAVRRRTPINKVRTF